MYGRRVKLSDRRGDTRANPAAGANLLPGSLSFDTTDGWRSNFSALEWHDAFQIGVPGWTAVRAERHRFSAVF
jgi:hypothetical protein